MGNSTVQPDVDTNASGQAEAFPYTATASGTVGHLWVYLDPSNQASEVVLGLYSNAGGAPGQLLTSGHISNPRAGAWNPVAVNPVAVVAGKTYWLAVLAPPGTGPIEFRDAGTSGGTDQTSAQSDLSTLPAQWNPGQVWQSTPASLYASS